MSVYEYFPTVPNGSSILAAVSTVSVAYSAYLVDRHVRKARENSPRTARTREHLEQSGREAAQAIQAAEKRMAEEQLARSAQVREGRLAFQVAYANNEVAPLAARVKELAERSAILHDNPRAPRAMAVAAEQHHGAANEILDGKRARLAETAKYAGTTELLPLQLKAEELAGRVEALEANPRAPEALVTATREQRDLVAANLDALRKTPPTRAVSDFALPVSAAMAGTRQTGRHETARPAERRAAITPQPAGRGA